MRKEKLFRNIILGLVIIGVAILSTIITMYRDKTIVATLQINNDDKIIVEHEGENIQIEISDETNVYDFIDTQDKKSARELLIEGTRIRVVYNGLPTYAEIDKEKVKSYEASTIEVLEILDEKRELSDGTEICIYKSSLETKYRLENGIELLFTRTNIDIDSILSGNAEQFKYLTSEARAKISKYFKEQGLIYDVKEGLEKSYKEYCESKNKNSYEGYTIMQDLNCTGGNEDVIYFTTSTVEPKLNMPIEEGREHTENSICTTFHCKTGEVIDNLELFSCDREEVLDKLLEVSEISDKETINEMKKVFSSKNIVMQDENIQVYFESGVLPSEEYTTIFTVQYSDLQDILYSWAIPNN